MTTFVLALMITIAGQTDAYVLDHDLTLDDCHSELRRTGESGKLTFTMGEATIRLTCQPQH